MRPLDRSSNGISKVPLQDLLSSQTKKLSEVFMQNFYYRRVTSFHKVVKVDIRFIDFGKPQAVFENVVDSEKGEQEN